MTDRVLKTIYLFISITTIFLVGSSFVLIHAQEDDESFINTYPFEPVPNDAIDFEIEEDRYVYTDDTLKFLREYFKGLLIFPRELLRDNFSGYELSYAKDYYTNIAGENVLSSVSSEKIRKMICDSQVENTQTNFNSELFCQNISDSFDPSDHSATNLRCVYENEDNGAINLNEKYFLFPVKFEDEPTGWDHEAIRMTAPFGYSEDYVNAKGEKVFHIGVDFSYNRGSTPDIRASNFGEVVLSGMDPNTASDSKRGYGNFVIINHDFQSKKLQTLYAHFETTPFVKVGDQVQIGTILGKMGTTGNSTGIHLHFEVRECKDFDESGKCIAQPNQRKQIDPYPMIFFSNELNGLDLPSDCYGEDERIINIIKPEDTNMDLNCMFDLASEVVQGVPKEALFAITKQETSFNCAPTWEEWRTTFVKCESTDQVALGSRNGWTNYDVRGLTQFLNSTFEGIVINQDFNACIEALGADLDISESSTYYDDGLSQEFRKKYSRHIVGQSICATAVKLKSDALRWANKSDRNEYKNLSMVSQEQWYKIIDEPYRIPFIIPEDEQIDFHVLEYVAHRYHGSCSKLRGFSETRNYYDAYCKNVNDYFDTTKNNNSIFNCN